ncbi:MAG: cytochrome c [Saprospiraceae bacterium]|nr:MAG: cytochrome c [Saprospiraceae bacterium]
MKRKNIQHLVFILIAAVLLVGFNSCQQAGGNKTGSEFIPDMTHSTAYEANVLTLYSLNSWDKESTFSRRQLSNPHLPVKGTVPRGYASEATNDGVFASPMEAVLSTLGKTNQQQDGIHYTPNGHVPYYYPDTDTGRILAAKKILYNPYPISKKGLATGQALFTIYCSICHGDKGDGAGYLVAGPFAKFPAQPANFTTDDFINSSNGRFYHAIMYGRNAMGSHADKLSFQERWQVIHYIRSLQAVAKKVKYNEEVNELNPEYGVPELQLPKPAATTAPAEAATKEPAKGTQEGAKQKETTGH